MTKKKPEVVRTWKTRGTDYRLVRVGETYAYGAYHNVYVIDVLGKDTAGDPSWHKQHEVQATPGSSDALFLSALGVEP